MDVGSLLLDTNIILYSIVSSHYTAEELIRNNKIFISEISEIELLGFHNLTTEEEKIIENLLNSFQIIDMNREIKKAAISLKKKYNLKTPDAIICASAMTEGLTFATADKKLQQISEIDMIKFDF